MARYRNSNKKRKPVAEINVVPYIDVMMVLLIVFMITAPMLTQGVKVDLPKVNTEALPSQAQSDLLVVSIKANGEFFLDLGNKQKKRLSVSRAQLGEKVAKVVRANPKLSVLINGDSKVPYGQVVSAMATLQQAGVPNVGLITEPVDQNK